MRFILNFIFFGFLFFIIWHFFPEAFATLVSWVSALFDFLRDLFLNIKSRVSGPTAAPVTEPAKTLLGLLGIYF
jgi:hypothetical protein